MKNNFCSIIVTTYRYGKREEVAKKSIQSLFENTTYPFELILVDNTQNNRGLSVARNVGYSMATGNFLCFTDDDIAFSPGWLTECIKMIHLGDKLLATPIHQPGVKKWELPPVEGYRRNWRCGSNCMVMKREAFEDIGKFVDFTYISPKYDCAKTGKEFATRLSRRGYSFLITKERMAKDMAIGVHSYYEA